MKKTTRARINKVITTIAAGMALTMVGQIAPINLINDSTNLICDASSLSADKLLFADSECCGPYHQCECPDFSNKS